MFKSFSVSLYVCLKNYTNLKSEKYNFHKFETMQRKNTLIQLQSNKQYKKLKKI